MKPATLPTSEPRRAASDCRCRVSSRGERNDFRAPSARAGKAYPCVLPQHLLLTPECCARMASARTHAWTSTSPRTHCAKMPSSRAFAGWSRALLARDLASRGRDLEAFAGRVAEAATRQVPATRVQGRRAEPMGREARWSSSIASFSLVQMPICSRAKIALLQLSEVYGFGRAAASLHPGRRRSDDPHRPQTTKGSRRRARTGSRCAARQEPSRVGPGA